MKDRRSFLRMVCLGFVALTIVVAPTIAEEIFGTITKVDVEGKKLTVVSKDDKETVVTINDSTEYVNAKGEASKPDLEKLSRQVAKAVDAGKKGVRAKVEHDKGVASKITAVAKKKAAAQ